MIITCPKCGAANPQLEKETVELLKDIQQACAIIAKITHDNNARASSIANNIVFNLEQKLK